MSAKPKTMLSAVTPSADITLGNYLGAIKNWVKLAPQYDCLFFAVDMHAITIKQNPEDLRRRTLHALATYIAAGIDPQKSLIFIQSHVPEHAELAWVLTCFSSMGELSRMTQFKDKSSKHGENIPAGIHAYPVLMAADILLYQTHLVPVGEDQKQHIELTRDLAGRLNRLFPPALAKTHELFTLPEPYIAKVGAKIMSLQNPNAKMSKSDPDPNASVFLSDDDKTIEKKLKRAVTDSGTEITADPQKPGILNLLTIQSAITLKSIDQLVLSYQGKQYGHLKVDTATIVVEELRPLKKRTQELLSDRAELERILEKSSEKARERAQKTLQDVYERIGFIKRPNF